MATQGTFEDGRQAQFTEMMEQLSKLQARYKGVRGELLQKVRDELEQLMPSKASPPEKPVAVEAPVRLARSANLVPTAAMLPSCRACGRTMKPKGDGTLICQNGHTRLLAG